MIWIAIGFICGFGPGVVFGAWWVTRDQDGEQ